MVNQQQRLETGGPSGKETPRGTKSATASRTLYSVPEVHGGALCFSILLCIILTCFSTPLRFPVDPASRTLYLLLYQGKLQHLR